MPFTHVVVDGSNIATEGRSLPSLAQLDEAVREFRAEFPHAEITVVVDATFGHRIDASERPAFDEAQAHGELVSPPAGAIGRGDAFLLRIADRSGATVLSNDSFQEFHGEYEWLFTRDRLIGGKPVPGIGWIFTPRTPVRGPKSRESMREARKTRVRIGSKEASRPMPVPKAPPPRPGAGKAKDKPKAALSDAIAAATEEVVSPQAPGSGRRRRKRSGGGPPPEAVNDPLTFISFIAEHPLGSELEGEVESFSSHGCFVTVAGARCYVPLSAMGNPPPRSAREVLNRGETARFVLQALDPQRRGIELALPGFAEVSGAPRPETVEAEIASVQPVAGSTGDASPKPAKKRAGRQTTGQKAQGAKKSASSQSSSARKASAGKPTVADEAGAAIRAAVPTAGDKTTVTAGPPASAGKAEPAPPAAAKRKATSTAKTATAKKTVPKTPIAKKAAATESGAAKRTASVKKAAPAKKAGAAGAAPAKKVAPARKAGTKKAASAKKAAGPGQASSAEKGASVKRATAATKKAGPAKKAAAGAKTAPTAKKTESVKKTQSAKKTALGAKPAPAGKKTPAKTAARKNPAAKKTTPKTAG